jgi:hypothetical protein
VITANGRIHWSRRRWAGGNVGSDCPVDLLLDDTEASVSVGVRQLCCREGTQARSFARGRENLRHAAQLQVGEEMFRQIVESEGRAIQKAGESEQLELDWSGSDCQALTPSGQATTRMYASADGVLLPVTRQAEKDKRRETVKKWRRETPRKKRGKLRRLPAVKPGSDQKYKQVYVSIFYDQEQSHRLVSVTRHGVGGLGRMLKRDGERVGLLEAKERVGLVDGAVCLKSNLEVLLLQAIVLDMYHFSEHVGDAAVATLGSDTPATKTFLDKALHTARHEGYAPFFQQIIEWRSPLRGHKRKAADALINYVVPRQEMIRYELCEAKGWDVGSGPMESMCGVTTDRQKGRGRRWDIENAESMMSIEALYQSTGLWDRYWRDAFNHRH